MREVWLGDLVVEMVRSHADFVVAARRRAAADRAEGGKARSLADGVGAAHDREHAAPIADRRLRPAR